VLVGKVNTAGQTISALAEHVGLVMQIPGNQLYGVRSTVFEEIVFGLENLGMSRQEMHERTTAALALTGLSAFAERSPYQLSGGQQQKVALAALLAVSPSLLVLDEPTTFLDPRGARQVFDILLELKRQGKTIILAEQRLEWIAEFADRVIVLQNGEIMLCDTPEEVLRHPQIKRMGLDWLPYTKAAAMAKEDGLWAQDRPLSSTFSATVAGLQNGSGETSQWSFASSSGNNPHRRQENGYRECCPSFRNRGAFIPEPGRHDCKTTRMGRGGLWAKKTWPTRKAV
jgi:energy-coupling factor transport system ATP-binding protein